MHFVASFIVLAILGIVDSGYLFYSHKRATPLLCPLDHDCSTVTESTWGTLLGVRNELLGLVYYSGLLAGAVTSLYDADFIPLFIRFVPLATGLGLLFSLILVLIQIVKIKDYCFYCLVSALLSALLFLNGFAFVKG